MNSSIDEIPGQLSSVGVPTTCSTNSHVVITNKFLLDLGLRLKKKNLNTFLKKRKVFHLVYWIIKYAIIEHATGKC